MLFTSLDRIYLKLFGDFPLSRLLSCVFAFMLILTVAFTSYLTINSNQKIVDSIVIRFAKNIAHEVDTELVRFLDTPAIINTNTQDAINAKRISPEDDNSISRFLWDAAHRELEYLVTSIYFADINGKHIGIDVTNSAHDETKHAFNVSAPFTGGVYTRIMPGPNGALGIPIKAFDPYDPRTRPWFKKAISNPDGAVWTDIYTDFDTGQATITRARAVRGDDNTILGVAAVDLFLEHLQQFLDTLTIGDNAEVFITDGKDLLVAAVAPGVTTNKPTHNVPTELAPFPYTLAATQYMNAQLMGQSKKSKTQSVSVTLGGADGLLYVSPIAAQYGLDWKLGIFLPKSDFVNSIWDQLKVLLPLIFVVILTAIGTIIGMLALVVKPLRQLSANTAMIAAGDFSVPIHAGGKNEVGVLAQSFEYMQSQLNSTFEDLLLRDRAIAEVDVGIIICDAQKNNFPILYVNNKMVSLTGYTREEFIGADLLTLEGTDPNHPAITVLREALKNNESAPGYFGKQNKERCRICT